MKLGLLGYTSGSIFNRTTKIGIKRLEQTTLGLSANRTSTSTITRKSGVFRPEDNGTKQYYKGDIQSFYSIATNNLEYGADQPSGLDDKPNGLVLYGISGRGDIFGSPFVDTNELTLGTSESLRSASNTERDLRWNSGSFPGNTYFPNLNGMRFKSDGTKLFGIGTLRRSATFGNEYYGTTMMIWSLSSGFVFSSRFSVPGAPSTNSGSFPEYYLFNSNGNNPSSSALDDPDISNSTTGDGGQRVKDAFMHPDGLIFYYLSNETIYQGSLSNAWSIGFGLALGASGGVQSLNTASLTVTPTDYSVNAFTFNSTGTKLFTYATTNNRIQQYNLGTAWQISSASISTSLDLTTIGGNKRIGIRMLNTESTIMSLSRVNTGSGIDSNGFLHEINQALY
jgi:hypothetical protein